MAGAGDQTRDLGGRVGPVGDVEEEEGGEAHRAQVADVLQDRALGPRLEDPAAEPDRARGVSYPRRDEGSPVQAHLQDLGDGRVVREGEGLPALQHVHRQADALLVSVQRVREVAGLQLVRTTEDLRAQGNGEGPVQKHLARVQLAHVPRAPQAFLHRVKGALGVPAHPQ